MKLLMLLALLVAPFIDEVIGKYQFDSLCKANSIEGADLSKARGRTVKVEYGESRPVKRAILPIKESDVRFRDASSGEILIEHKNFHAGGGWLMRYTWVSLGANHPMLFDGDCIDFLSRKSVFSAHGITQQN